jgi:hypothetical protein
MPRDRRAAEVDRPEVTGTTPVMQFSKVDLPAPLAPRMATISPGSTRRETPRSAATLPYAACRPSTWRSASLIGGSQVGFHDLRMAQDISRRAQRQGLAVDHRQAAVAQGPDHRHVVLDDHHRAARRTAA